MRAAIEKRDSDASDPSVVPGSGILRVGEHRLDIGSLRLIGDAPHARLTLKSMQILLELYRHHGATVTREHLLDTIWRDTSPTPEVVTQGIKELRRVLGDNTETPRYIETVPKLGYRLIAPCTLESAETEQAASPAAKQVLPLLRKGAILLIAIAAVCVASAMLLFRAERSASQPTREWKVDRVQRVTTTPLWEGYSDISADGTQVVYLAKEMNPADGRANMHAKVRQLVGSGTIDLPIPAGSWDTRVRWMPNDSEVVVARRSEDRCEILSMPALGGPTRLLAQCSTVRPPNFDFSADGRFLIGSDFTTPSPRRIMLQRQAIGGGPVEALDYEYVEGLPDFAPLYSPDGKWIAFRRGMLPYSDLYLINAEPPREVRRLTTLGARLLGFDWTPDSTSIVFSSDHEGRPGLYVVDVHSLHVEALGISPAYMPSLARSSDAGTYSIPDQQTQFALAAVDSGQPAYFPSPSTTDDREAALSPDAQRIAFITQRSARNQVWLHELETGDSYALSAHTEGTPRYPSWRSDGRALAYVLRGTGPGIAVEVDLTTRKQSPLSPRGLDVHHVTYAADGRVFVVALNDGQQGLYVLREQNAVLIERGVSLVRVGDAQTGILVNYSDRLGVFRLGSNGQPSTKVADAPNFRNERPWSLSGSKIFYVADEFPNRRIREFDVATGEERIAATIELGLGIRAVTSDASGRNLLAWVSKVEGSDIGSFRLRRSSAHESP
jgi:DNA-binding winged helix-turn-helix (wHTH) protein